MIQTNQLIISNFSGVHCHLYSLAINFSDIGTSMKTKLIRSVLPHCQFLVSHKLNSQVLRRFQDFGKSVWVESGNLFVRVYRQTRI